MDELPLQNEFNRKVNEIEELREQMKHQLTQLQIQLPSSPHFHGGVSLAPWVTLSLVAVSPSDNLLLLPL